MSALDKLADSLIATSSTAAPFAVGTVKSSVANGSDPPTVTITWQGADVIARCPRHYTPVVGHIVAMARFGPQLLIIGAY